MHTKWIHSYKDHIYKHHHYNYYHTITTTIIITTTTITTTPTTTILLLLYYYNSLPYHSAWPALLPPGWDALRICWWAPAACPPPSPPWSGAAPGAPRSVPAGCPVSCWDTYCRGKGLARALERVKVSESILKYNYCIHTHILYKHI